MNERLPPDPVHHAMLTELAALGMQAARVLVRVMESEQAGVVAAEGCLPAAVVATGLGEATAAGLGMDMAAAALAASVPRLEVLARALERVSRSVRRSVALARRLQCGWPRAGSDDRPAMMQRQVARGVGEAIARNSDGEAAEHLFGELAERLDDPDPDRQLLALPVEAVVRRICGDLGLAAQAMTASCAEVAAAPRGAGPGRAAPGGGRMVDTC